jgi:hypothetical protein
MRSLLAVAVSIAVPAVSFSVSFSISFPVLANPAPSAAPPAPAAARPDPLHAADPVRMVTDDCAKARKAGKTCELTLTAEDVGGATPGPDDIALRIRSFGQATSLIHVRRDFLVEIVRSAEDL